MCSSISSEGPRLVRFAVPCAQTEMHSRMNGAKRHAFREACSAGHRASSKAVRMVPLNAVVCTTDLSHDFTMATHYEHAHCRIKWLSDTPGTHS